MAQDVRDDHAFHSPRVMLIGRVLSDHGEDETGDARAATVAAAAAWPGVIPRRAPPALVMLELA